MNTDAAKESTFANLIKIFVKKMSVILSVTKSSIRRSNMNNEINRLQQAKMFINYLANGIDPVFYTNADADTLHNEQVISCFRYISDVLTSNIYQAENDIKKNNDFYITDKQISELRTFPYNCKVSELANEINRFAEYNGTKKMSAVWINDWLEAEEYLCKVILKVV